VATDAQTNAPNTTESTGARVCSMSPLRSRTLLFRLLQKMRRSCSSIVESGGSIGARGASMLVCVALSCRTASTTFGSSRSVVDSPRAPRGLATPDAAPTSAPPPASPPPPPRPPRTARGLISISMPMSSVASPAGAAALPLPGEHTSRASLSSASSKRAKTSSMVGAVST
jgi:hypothetical protein